MSITLFSILSCKVVTLGGLVVSVLAIEQKVCAFKPCWIFKGDKKFVADFLWRGSKAVSSMS
jgi:hypothetical protein